MSKHLEFYEKIFIEVNDFTSKNLEEEEATKDALLAIKSIIKSSMTGFQGCLIACMHHLKQIEKAIEKEYGEEKSLDFKEQIKPQIRFNFIECLDSALKQEVDLD